MMKLDLLPGNGSLLLNRKIGECATIIMRATAFPMAGPFLFLGHPVYDSQILWNSRQRGYIWSFLRCKCQAHRPDCAWNSDPTGLLTGSILNCWVHRKLSHRNKHLAAWTHDDADRAPCRAHHTFLRCRARLGTVSYISFVFFLASAGRNYTTINCHR